MKNHKILGIVVIGIGAVLMVFSQYIAEKVSEGKEQIASGQKKVDAIDSVFSVSEYSKPLGKALTSPAQKKIDAGKVEVSQYEALSKNLQIAGAIVAIVGLGLFFLWKRGQ